MRLRQGRIGFLEGMSLAALSIFTGGVFALDPKFAYANGNSTYLSLPLSVMLSFFVLLPALSAMEKRNCESLPELLTASLGRVPSAVLSAVLAAAFAVAAAKPLTCFLEVLHRLVYDGVSYGALLAFVLPVVVIVSIKGFESVGRLALIFGAVSLFAAAIAVLSASPEFELSRLYPLPGNEAGSFLQTTVSRSVFFLAPLSALLVNGSGLAGAVRVRKIAAAAAVVSAIAIGLTQLAIGLIYPARVLEGLLMPLYRINFLSLSQSYALRLDKLFIMAWLAGAMISAAFLIYSASLLLTRSFGARDVLPSVLTVSLAVGLIASLSFFRTENTADAFRKLENRFGFLTALIPILAAGVLGHITKRVK